MNANFQADAKIAKIAEAYALDAVDFAARNFQIILDWSDDNVRLVEGCLKTLHDQLGDARPAEETVWTFAKVFGSYVGEVFRRNHGGEWGMIQLDGESFPGIQYESGVLCWPWSRAYKRITIGGEENIWHYYCILLEKTA